MSYNRKKLRELIKLYEQAKTKGENTFVMDGGLYTTIHAKYLIDYLSKRFGYQKEGIR